MVLHAPLDRHVGKPGEEISRALVEVKKASNSKFWNGLLAQLPTYFEAEEVKFGCFLVMCYNDKDLERVKDIESKVAELNKKLPYKMSVRVIDASRPESASKLQGSLFSQ